MKLFNHKTQPTVLYISRAGVGIFPDGAQPTVLNFPPDLFPDLEITGGEEDFRQLLLSWQQKNEVEITDCLIVFASDVYYFQDSSSSNPNEDPIVQQYINAIPFEDVKIHVAGISTGFRVVALNNEWYSLITRAIEKLKWNIKMTLPDFVVADIIKPEGFDVEAAAQVSARVETLMPYNMYSPPVIPESEQKLHISTSTRISSTTIGLIVFFVLLLVVLGVVLYMNVFADQTLVPPQTATDTGSTTAESIFINPEPTQIPVALVSPIASQSAVASASAEFSVQILNGSGVENQATQLKNLFLENGFDKVTIGNSSSSAVSSTLVVFSSKVSLSVQKNVIELVESLDLSPSTRVSSETLEADIVVTTGQK